MLAMIARQINSVRWLVDVKYIFFLFLCHIDKHLQMHELGMRLAV